MTGGGRCSIDHYREDEVSIQLILSYQDDTVRVEASLDAPTACTILVQAIPKIKKQLDCYQGMVWSIRTRAKKQQHAASLETMILERYYLDQRMRIASSGDKEVWQYMESNTVVRALFIDEYLQATTHSLGIAHAEALVHPALLSAYEPLETVVILSLEPTAILKEVLKHTRVKSVILVGVDPEAMKLTQQYLAQHDDCSFMARPVKECLSQSELQIITDTVTEWLMKKAAADETHISSFLVDVPPGNEEWLDLELQTKIRAVLSMESVAIVSTGSAPVLSGVYDLDARHALLRQAPREAGLDYFQIYVYDEVRLLYFGFLYKTCTEMKFALPTVSFRQPLSRPFASSFLVLLAGDSDILDRFIRTNVPAIEVDIVEYFHPTKDGPLTLVYDGATHASYQRPFKAWQHWYCNTPPGNEHYVCNKCIKNWYNQDNHHYRTEVRKDPTKGRSLVALEAIPQGHFVLPMMPQRGSVLTRSSGKRSMTVLHNSPMLTCIRSYEIFSLRTALNRNPWVYLVGA
jgi:hypothetical protein